MKPSHIHVSSAVIALGAIAWLVTRLVVQPPPDDVMHATEIAGGGLFQIGLIAMLLTMRATNATGTGRGGRFVVNAGLLFVVLGTLWTVLVVIDMSLADNPAILALDVFWPLSMAWLIVVGVAVIRAGRWPSPARYLPLAASFVIPAHLVAEIAGLTEWQSWVLPVAYVAVSYPLVALAVSQQVAPLGQQLAQHPDAALTGSSHA